jgi:hypothetical protein
VATSRAPCGGAAVSGRWKGASVSQSPLSVSAWAESPQQTSLDSCSSGLGRLGVETLNSAFRLQAAFHLTPVWSLKTVQLPGQHLAHARSPRRDAAAAAAGALTGMDDGKPEAISRSSARGRSRNTGPASARTSRLVSTCRLQQQQHRVRAAVPGVWTRSHLHALRGPAAFDPVSVSD